jgi:hypothetical protein
MNSKDANLSNANTDSFIAEQITKKVKSKRSKKNTNKLNENGFTEFNRDNIHNLHLLEPNHQITKKNNKGPRIHKKEIIQLPNFSQNQFVNNNFYNRNFLPPTYSFYPVQNANYIYNNLANQKSFLSHYPKYSNNEMNNTSNKLFINNLIKDQVRYINIGTP